MSSTGDLRAQPGMARLAVVIPAAMIGMLGSQLRTYALPLYFPARALPPAAWETYFFYVMFSWLFASTAAGFLASRLGERRVWALGLGVSAALCVWLIVLPLSDVRPLAAVAVAGVFAGCAQSFAWVGGISLVQKVPVALKGRANGLFLGTIAVAGMAAPILGRFLVEWSAGTATPTGRDFVGVLVAYGVLSATAGTLIILGAEHKKGATTDGVSLVPPKNASTLRQTLRLLRSPHYLALGIPVGLLAGALFAATNVYRAYRAADPAIALRVGSEDHGWAALSVVAFAMQMVGSLLVSRLAGRRASHFVAAALLAIFALLSAACGWAPDVAAFFVFSALFEIMRQVARWLNSGYVSEHMPEEQQSASIGFTVTLSGLGAWGFLAVMRAIQSPDLPGFSASLPFYVAAAVGLAGAAILVVAGSLHRRERAGAPLSQGRGEDDAG